MIYFFTSSGKITRRVSCPLAEAVFFAQEGEQWIEFNNAVSDETHYIHNGTVVAFPQSPGTGCEWNWTTLTWELSENSFSELKTIKNKEIDLQRDKVRYSGVIYNGVRFDSDPTSSSNLTGWVSGISSGITLPQSFTWRSENNEDIPFTEGDVLSLASVMLFKATACYKKAWELKETLKEIDTYQDLIDFDIFSGWPE